MAELSAILREITVALRDKGYDPVDQIAGYLLSGDPTYITNHDNARALIKRLERDDIMRELLSKFDNNALK